MVQGSKIWDQDDPRVIWDCIRQHNAEDASHDCYSVQLHQVYAFGAVLFAESILKDVCQMYEAAHSALS